jgi:DNA mismatch repair protein MutL
MNIIRILDDTTANKIAAGEVVERPASVIKELVENSIDAQSSLIEIEIAEAGTSFIRITDNGTGMSAEDAKLAILRHATSKIRKVEDLYHIHSLGFRGEALPSIAAVSKFSLTTRQKDQPMATYIEVHGGSLEETREAGANPGTTIIVKDLFYNTPARKKFLKTLSTESSHIHDVLTKLALSNPDIAFKLLNNNRLVLSTPGTGQLQDTLASLYGHQIIPDLLEVTYHNEEDQILISGYLAKPTLLKSSRLWQTFIINSRVISSRSIAKALDNAYHSLLPKSGFPLAVLNLKVSPETIDVNVHPQKSEVKFSDEQKIFRTVYKAVTTVLSKPHNPGQLAASIQVKDARQYQYNYPRDNINHTYVPSQPEPSWKEETLPFSAAQTQIRREKEFSLPAAVQQYGQSLTDDYHTAGTDIDAAQANGSNEPQLLLQPLGQVEDCYIITRGQDGLYIIDQHAAHERILYDKLSLNLDRIPAQQLLVPLFLEFDKREIEFILEHQDTFHYLGFSLDMAGPTTIRLSELPSDVPAGETGDFIREVLEAVQNMHSPSPQQLRHKCMQMTACRAAIKAGETLNMRQMQALVTELCNTTLPYTCPHGRPAMVRFSPADLAKLFKRT